MVASSKCFDPFINRVAAFAVALFLCPLFISSTGCSSTKDVTEKKLETITFIEQKENDFTLPEGQTIVKQEGVNGTKEVTFKVTYQDGKEIKREKASEKILSSSVPKIIRIGVAPGAPPQPNPYPRHDSGYEAGYEWASDHGITDPDDCGGNSESFIEGCQAYAEEQQEEQQNQDENGDYDDGGE